MHQQIRTSPRGVDQNVRRGLEALAGGKVNVEGVGPDYEAPHVRFVVPHDARDAAVDRLRDAGFEPELRSACTFAVPNRAGQLSPILARIVDAGLEIDSVLVLASRYQGRTMVSVGVRGEISEEQCAALGGLEEPMGWGGGDIVEPSAS